MSAEASGAPFCASASREAHETLIGTASKDGARFLLLEHDEPWGRDPMADSELAEPLKARLEQAASARPGTRIAFVRPVGRAEPRPRLYVAGGAERAEGVVVVDLPGYDALLELPIEALLDGEPFPGAIALEEPLAIVCTHGKRDRCCAKFGVALAQDLTREPGLAVLQSSHLGGHRFAAVVVTLPDGMTYGHLDASDAPGLAEAIRNGALYRPERHFRGRAGLDEPSQVADAQLRIERSLGADAPLSAQTVGKDERGARVRLTLGDETIEMHVRRRALEVLRPASCFEEPTPAQTFDVEP